MTVYRGFFPPKDSVIVILSLRITDIGLSLMAGFDPKRSLTLQKANQRFSGRSRVETRI